MGSKKLSNLRYRNVLQTPLENEVVDEITRHKEDTFTDETLPNGARSPMYDQEISTEIRRPIQLPSGQLIEYKMESLSKP